MKLEVDYSVTGEFYELFKNENYKNEAYRDKFISNLTQNDSFKKQIDFHKGNMTSEDYFEIIFNVLDEIDIESDNCVKIIVTNSFNNIFNRIDLLIKKFNNIKEYNFKKLEDRLSNALPKDTPLDINISIVLDGFNAGSILNSSNMLLDAIFWPSNKEKENQIEGVILHEYHHIGLLYWLEKNEKRNVIIQQKNGFGLSVQLLESIIGEGSATYIFNQNEDLTDLLEEGYGEAIAKQYSESVNINRIIIEQLINKFQNDLECLLENKENYEKLKDIISDYGFSREYGQPIDKSIGVYMCETIELVEGRIGLIEIFEYPMLFLSKYNEAAKKLNRIKLKEKIVDDYTKIWQ